MWVMVCVSDEGVGSIRALFMVCVGIDYVVGVLCVGYSMDVELLDDLFSLIFSEERR